MKTNLPKKITTITEAKAFLTDLVNNNEAYHPEDNAHTIMWHQKTDDQPSHAEREQLNKLMADIYDVNKVTPFDPCQFILELDERETTLLTTRQLDDNELARLEFINTQFNQTSETTIKEALNKYYYEVLGNINQGNENDGQPLIPAI